MPVFKVPTVAPAARETLVATLVAELSDAPTGASEPAVFELPLPPSKKLLVVVVWSKWAAVAWADRPPMITDAYARWDAEHPGQPPRTPSVGIAYGLTWDEADENAFFKFGIVSMARAGEVDPEALARAMRDEGAFDTPHGLRLRYWTQAEADRSFERLKKRLPAAEWSLFAQLPKRGAVEYPA
ncbi:MAG: hypothetical protein ACRC7O_04920 [Fimbriiglobus sp.]